MKELNEIAKDFENNAYKVLSQRNINACNAFCYCYNVLAINYRMEYFLMLNYDEVHKVWSITREYNVLYKDKY